MRAITSKPQTDAAARAALAALAAAWDGRPDAPSRPLHRRFAPDTPAGRLVYESFTDEALCALLRENAQALGHSPAKHEIYWIYRAYLIARFGNWPSALRRAGLSRAAGRGGKSPAQAAAEAKAEADLLAAVRDKAAALGRMPHPSDLPEVCAALRKRYRTWGELLDAAGARAAVGQTVHRIDGLEPPFRAMLDTLRRQAEQLGRAPLRQEADPALRAALMQRCGSWRNALYQIGLEPVSRITPFAGARLRDAGGSPHKHRTTLHDCHYRLLRLDAPTRDALAQVQALADRLGRAPRRREVPEAVRRQLQAACGSWSNALYQLGLSQ